MKHLHNFNLQSLTKVSISLLIAPTITKQQKQPPTNIHNNNSIKPSCHKTGQNEIYQPASPPSSTPPPTESFFCQHIYPSSSRISRRIPSQRHPTSVERTRKRSELSFPLFQKIITLPRFIYPTLFYYQSHALRTSAFSKRRKIHSIVIETKYKSAR